MLAYMGISTTERMASWLEQRMESNATMLQAALRMQEAARVCTCQCKTVEDVLQMVSLELLYKTMNLRVATYMRAQKQAQCRNQKATCGNLNSRYLRDGFNNGYQQRSQSPHHNGGMTSNHSQLCHRQVATLNN